VFLTEGTTRYRGSDVLPLDRGGEFTGVRFGPREIGTFAQAAADLDIAVLPDAGVFLDAREKVEIALALEELFGVSRVDLVVLPVDRPDAGADPESAARQQRILPDWMGSGSPGVCG
jgi:hypothetical protein